MNSEIEVWFPEKKKGRTWFSRVVWSSEINFWVYDTENPIVNYVLAPIRKEQNESV